MSAPHPAAPVLAYRGACIGYGATEVVHGVDLEVAAGDCVALLGPNGSGKTTLVRAALGLADLTSGSLEVLGTPVGDLTRRAALGYVPQRHTVATSVPATVAEVVGVGRLARTDPVRRLLPAGRRRDRAVVAEALEAVGLADRARSSVSELSGGQQRRVLIARALASEPELMLLDEPTAGVDEASQHALVEVLAALVGRGVSMVIVTHELAAVRGVVDRAVRLVDGRVREDARLRAPGEPRVHAHDPDEDHPCDHHDGADAVREPAPFLTSPWGAQGGGR